MKSSVAIDCLLTLISGLHTSRDVSLPELANDAFWLDMATQANKLGVAALLYYRLKNNTAVVPAGALAKLKTAYHTTAFRNKMIYATLLGPLRALQASGISVIVLKGAYLAEAVYGNIALRPMTDIDILVQNHDIPRVESILLGLGFDAPEHPRIRGHRESRIAFHKMGGASIEVHWILDRPDSPFLIDHEGLWRRARTACICGLQTLCLSAEDLLLHLCWQAAVNKRFKKGLCPFFDIHATIHRFSDIFDWNAFFLRAQQWNLMNCAYVSLMLTQDFFKTDIPREFLIRMRSPVKPPEMTAYARELVFSQPSLSVTFLRLVSGRSLREKLHIVRNLFFPGSDALKKKYRLGNRALPIYFYYPAYWTSLLAKCADLVRKTKQEHTITMQVEAQRKQDLVQKWLRTPVAPS